MPHKFLLLLFILTTFASFSQNKYEIGVEGGVTNDRYRYKDPLNNIRKVPCISGGGGITLRKNMKKNFFLETAIFLRESSFGFKLKQESGYSTTNGNEFITLPLRAGYSLKLSKKVSIAPTAGIAVAYKTFGGESSGSVYSPNDGVLVEYEYEERSTGNNFLFLLHGSIALEIIVLKKIRFSFAPGYYHGLTKSNVFDVDYRLTTAQNTTAVKAVINGYGSFVNYNFGLKYLIPAKKR